MGIGSAKKTPSKKGRSSAQERRSPSKALKAEQSPASSSGSATPETSREKGYTHNLPTQEQRKGNGRVLGRSLIMWSRPRMAEKLLMHIHYECTRHKINLPWDAIAHRLHPGSSGAAVLQHVNRLRRELVAEGHLVPPVPQKSSPTSQFDPNIRGYVRKYPSGDDKETTRPIMFDERLDDPKFNLPDAFDLEDDGQQAFDDVNATVSDDDDDDDSELPDTPTPIRRLPRGAMQVPNYNMRPFPKAKDQNDAIDDSENCDGFANQSFMLEHKEAATSPDMSMYATPRGRHVMEIPDEDSFFNHSFHERPILPRDGHGEERRSAKRRGISHDPQESHYPGFPYYPPYEGMIHPGFYGVGGHGYTMPYPMGFPMPPYYPVDRHDPRAPITKQPPTPAKSPMPDQKGEILSPEPENPKVSHMEELMIPNVNDEAINPELRVR